MLMQNYVLRFLRSRRYRGPTKPPKLPIEFISPIATAAAAPDKYNVGKLQKEPKPPSMPMVISTSAMVTIVKLLGKLMPG